MKTFDHRTREVLDMKIKFDIGENAFILKSKNYLLYLPAIDIQCLDEEEWGKTMKQYREILPRIMAEVEAEEQSL